MNGYHLPNKYNDAEKVFINKIINKASKSQAFKELSKTYRRNILFLKRYFHRLQQHEEYDEEYDEVY